MDQKLKRIAVTGASGQIAYSLLFRLASGELLGKTTPLALHLLEVPAALDSLKGVVMELEDCAYPLLREIKTGSDPLEVFRDCDYVFLVGAKPRGPGMERKDLLAENGRIFHTQGKALNAVAPKALVLVVGNPCNTNCLIAQKNAPAMKPSQFFAMTRLDHNRGLSMLAKKAGVEVSAVSHLTIWGNHSSTQVPDFIHAKIQGKPATAVIRDKNWLENTFFSEIQKRGSTVISARGKSSAASAANAALEAMQSLLFPTPKETWFSMALLQNDSPYPVEKDLVFSYPCRSKGGGVLEIVPGLEWTPFLQEKIAISKQELLEERALVEGLL